MKQLYVIIIFLFALCFSVEGFSQERQNSINTLQTETVNVYPNPVKNGVVTIASKSDHKKNIEVYNVLGKQVLKTSLLKNKLNVSKLPSGIYILKISIQNQEFTRKLVVE
ncbi:T9SS type A sorting domain-containing protein [Mangrovimonas cancribranchiae]|uniref:T9SS type A sorting domain-containing protein n=1 Tax=Mangrovimonas cancribranchiae TaxID=3080055 RepID=A0AAU6P2P6_9FLAO